MQRIGVLYNPLAENSMRVSAELTTWLQQQGKEVWCGTSQEGRDNPDAVSNMDLLVALGGDGTVLRAARLSILHNIPILPVALGHLSFMAEIGPDELYSSLHILMNGDGWHDQRALVTAVLQHGGHVAAEFTVLNEVAVSRGDISRIVTVEVQIDGVQLTTYRADGVLVSTATGSTAYALSAGGPIVDPRSKSLILVPVAAHLTSVSSMVLHEDSVITLHLRSRYQASLSVDGHDNILLQEGDEVQVRRSDQVCTFARIEPPSQFYAGLVKRLRRD